MTDSDRDARIAALIAQRRANASNGIVRVDDGGPVPLSSIQLGIFAMVAVDGPGHGNRPSAIALDGPLDHDVLRRALDALVLRHEPLRTRYPFDSSNAEPVQEVLDPVPVDLTIVDVSSLGREQRRHRTLDVMAQASAARLDPGAEAFFDATLVRHDDDHHVLVIAMHHMGFDGWSEAVFVADLVELYRAALDGVEPQLPQLAVRYTDYARWERAQLAQHDVDADIAYWRTALAGLGHAPAMRPTVGADDVSDDLEREVTARLSADEMAAVRSLARAEKTTPFVVLLAALELLQRELTDADDFVTFCPVAGRDRPETQDLVGCFINHLYVRSGLPGAETHLDHVRRVRARVTEALAHRRAPARSMIEQFLGTRNAPPVFRMSLQWRDFPRRDPAGPVPITAEVVPVPASVQGLAVSVQPDGDEAIVDIRYNPRQFSHEDAEIWADRLRRHVRSICGDPEASILPHRPLQPWPQTDVLLAPEPVESVVTSIRRQVRTWPDARAIDAASGTLTYDELWERSGRVAAALLASGVEAGEAVVIASRLCPGHVVAMLGVLRAGALAVPVDEALPRARASTMSRAVGARVEILVDGGSVGAAAVQLSVDRTGQLDHDVEPMDTVGVDPVDDLAYVFFTSGTSGEPKGIRGTHAGVAHLLAWERGRLGIRPSDRVAGVTGVSFDVSLREMFLPLTSGATLDIVDPDLGPHRVLAELARREATIVHITPARAAAWLAESDRVELASLRWVAFAGEPLTDTLVETWRSIAPHARVLNLYGPSETCMVKAAFEVGRDPVPGVQPVGHALPHSQLIVVDPDSGERCAPGTWGEVVIRTAVGTAGYLDPALDGLRPVDGVTLYRTGDRGTSDPDGLVTVAGRLDHQVKVDGVRVEPAEAARVLERHPAVARAVVVVTNQSPARLEAHVVSAGGSLDTHTLRDHLRAWLPAAAIPAVFHIVDAIPLTPNGKVDEAALRGDATESTVAGDQAAPSADGVDLGEAVAAIWKAVLGVDVAETTNFFEAGGTSLRAVRISARLEEQLGLMVDPPVFFDHPTLRDFMAAVRGVDSSVASEATSPDGRGPVSALVPSRVEAVADRRPEATAVVDGATVITYEAFDQKVAAMAAQLRAAGVTANTVVAVLAERSVATLAAMHAAWRLGAAYVPLDPAAPAARNQLILDDIDAAVVVAPGAGAPPSWLTAPVVTPELDGPADVGAPVALAGASTAYIIYTSGSSGKPKGVRVSHGALAAFVDAAESTYGLDSQSRVFQFHSLAFDASVEETHVPLALGATVVLRSDAALGSARSLMAEVGAQGVTTLSLPTSLWHELVPQMRETGASFPAALGTVIIGGEAARPDIVRVWQTLVARPSLINSYGPTETTVVALAALVDDADPGDVVSIGRPVGQMRAAVRAPGGEPVRAGEWGELCLSGPQLADGYVGMASETAEAFVVSPDGTRWYRTGDRGRVRPGGDYEVAGRLDDQVKIDGHRVEVGEVERAIRSIPGVRDVAVLVDHHAGRVSLTAHVATDLAAEQVRAQLGRIVPAAMVPERFEIHAELPTGVSGKVDRQGLRAPAPADTTDGAADSAAAAPAAPIGQSVLDRIIAMWCELLDVTALAPDADFFESGGRSLTVVRMSYLLEEEFGVEVSVSDVFDARTPMRLAALLGEVLPAQPVATQPDDAATSPQRGGETPAPVAQPAAAPEPAARRRAPLPQRLHLQEAPLSLGQQRLWLHGQLRSESLPYLISLRFRLRGSIDRSALRSAVFQLVERHEALRTRIVVGPAGRPLQIIDPVPDDVIDFVDVSRGDPETRREAARERARSLGASPIDLASDHGLRMALIGLGPEEHLLCVVVHHAVVDGHALQIMMADLSEAYDRIVEGTAPAPPGELQFGDFAVWQRARLAEGHHAASLRYWQERLGPEPRAIEVPGRRRDSKPGGGIELHDVDLSASSSTGLVELASSVGASPFQLLVALSSAVLHRLTGEPHVLVGAPASERTHPAFEDVVGVFVNTLVLDARFDADTAFAGLLDQVRNTTAAALEHSGVPFDAVVEAVAGERGTEALPLIGAMCEMRESSEESALHMTGVDVSRVPGDQTALGTVADLMISGRVVDGGLAVTLKHDRGVLAPDAVARVADVFEQVAAGAYRQPERAIASLALVSSDEAEWLVDELNDNAVELPEVARVEELFASVVAARPDEVAIDDGDRSLTRAQLDREARGLAAALREAGLATGDTVAVAAPRGVGLAVALLGTLMAGGVYVPIDAAAPPARTDRMRRLAGARFKVSVVDGSLDITVDTDVEPVALPVGVDDPAYVMFTSGSTGEPKGVVVGHRAIIRTIHDVDYASVSEGTVVAMASNPAFDALTFELWGGLLNGGRIEVIDGDTLTDPRRLGAFLRNRQVELLFLTTAMVNLAVAEHPETFASLDTLLVGGEAADTAVMASLLDVGPKRLVNIYGPTECTTYSAWHLVTRDDVESGSVPIGGPTRNTQLHVLDAAGRLMPPELPGELCIGGFGLSHGYVGDAELTAQRFPTVDLGGSPVRVYRTGDIVRRRRDGAIEFLGRRDHQIKLRGFRIELAEIEAALATIDEVRSGIVLVTGSGAARRLTAFVTLSADLSVDELRRSLQTAVPAYMVPATFHMLDEMPITATGKVDRNALEAMDAERGEEPAVPIAAEDLPADLAAMVTLWREVLRQPVGPDDDFFATGGNSLMGVQLLSEIERRFGSRLGLSVLFEARTPRQIQDEVSSVGSPELGRPEPIDHLVRLRSTDDGRPPLWLMHPAGGSLVLYEPMVSHLRTPRSVFGVEALGLDGSVPPLVEIEAIADHQVSVIRRAQPTGPYRIVGYSVGGIIGVEVARRLIAGGDEVELLAAVEAGVPTPPKPEPTRRQKYLTMLRQRDLRGVAGALATSARERMSDAVTAVSEFGDIAAVHRRVLDANTDAYLAYRPKPLDIGVTVLFGNETPTSTVSSLRERWTALCTQGATVVQVGGSHHDDAVLRPPHAKILAMAIEELLDRCDRSAEE